MISHIQLCEYTSGVETIDEKWQNSTSLLKERQTSTPELLSWYIPSSMTKDDARSIILALPNERHTAITPKHQSSCLSLSTTKDRQDTFFASTTASFVTPSSYPRSDGVCREEFESHTRRLDTPTSSSLMYCRPCTDYFIDDPNSISRYDMI